MLVLWVKPLLEAMTVKCDVPVDAPGDKPGTSTVTVCFCVMPPPLAVIVTA